MKMQTTIAILMMTRFTVPALADGHQQAQREATRTEAKKAEGSEVRQAKPAEEPRGGKPKPKPKPKPQKESGEKGGTEDLNIGIGELQE